MCCTRFCDKTTLCKEKSMSKMFCLGRRCPIKNQCLRYTQGIGVVIQKEASDMFVRTCTNQKMFIQDERNINTDSKRI